MGNEWKKLCEEYGIIDITDEEFRTESDYNNRVAQRTDIDESSLTLFRNFCTHEPKSTAGMNHMKRQWMLKKFDENLFIQVLERTFLMMGAFDLWRIDWIFSKLCRKDETLVDLMRSYRYAVNKYLEFKKRFPNGGRRPDIIAALKNRQSIVEFFRRKLMVHRVSERAILLVANSDHLPSAQDLHQLPNTDTTHVWTDVLAAEEQVRFIAMYMQFLKEEISHGPTHITWKNFYRYIVERVRQYLTDHNMTGLVPQGLPNWVEPNILEQNDSAIAQISSYSVYFPRVRPVPATTSATRFVPWPAHKEINQPLSFEELGPTPSLETISGMEPMEPLVHEWLDSILTPEHNKRNPGFDVPVEPQEFPDIAPPVIPAQHQEEQEILPHIEEEPDEYELWNAEAFALGEQTERRALERQQREQREQREQQRLQETDPNTDPESPLSKKRRTE